MFQNPCKTLGFKKNMVYKIPLGEVNHQNFPGGGGVNHILPVAYTYSVFNAHFGVSEVT